MMAAMIAPRYAPSIATRYAPVPHSGFPMRCMKTVEEVRRERLALLRKEFGTLVALNEKLGLNTRDATLSQILNSATNSRTGTPKAMGSKMARDLESACGKEVGWMDTDPAIFTSLPQEVTDFAAALEKLSQEQKDLVLTTVRDVIALAQQIIPGTAKAVTRSSAPAKAAHPLEPVKRLKRR